MEMTDTVGRRLGQVTFPIERSKLMEFARALHDDDPVWHDPGAAGELGFAGVPTPPTITVLAAHWVPGGLIGPPVGLGMDVERLLHGESAWTYETPVRLGDELTATMTVADVTRREGRRGGSLLLLVIETAFVNQRGERVATLRDTWVEKAAA